MIDLIGTHLDEEENTPRALQRFLGMTAEEMIECGVKGVELDAKASLIRKIADSFDTYQAKWRQMNPNELIEHAEEIASIRRTANNLVFALTVEDAEYFLRFKNPLEVISDKVRLTLETGNVIHDALTDALYFLRDCQDAELDYEMEPGYTDPPPPSPNLAQQMSI